MKPIVYQPEYVLVPDGPGHWIICAVKHLGRLPNFHKTGDIDTLGVCFESASVLAKGGRFTMWKRVNGESLHPKSSLGKILAAVGVVLQPGDSFDPASLIGKNLTLLIKHTMKGDRTYADIDGFAKLPAGVTPEVPEHKPDEPMPSWLQPQPPVNAPAKQW